MNKEQMSLKKELSGVQSQIGMMQSFVKLKQSMNDMKDREIKTCKETMEQLKNQIKALQSNNKAEQQASESESNEALRAKVHSLAFLNLQFNDTQQQMKENMNQLQKELEARNLEMIELKNENTNIIKVKEDLRSALEYSKNEKKRDEELNNKLSNEIKKLQEQSQNDIQSLKEQWSKEVSDINESCQQQIQYSLQAAKEESEHRNEVFEKRLTDLIHENERLTSQLQNFPLVSQVQEPLEVQNPLFSKLNLQFDQLREQSNLHFRSQQREIELTQEISHLQQLLREALQKALIADEVDSMRHNFNIMTDQLKTAQNVNNNLVSSYQTIKEDCRVLKETNKTLELSNTAMMMQFKEFTEENSPDFCKSLQQLSNRTYATVRQHLESKGNSGNVDIERFREHWIEMQKEREKEKKLMTKLISQIRKSLSIVNNIDKVDKLFLYMDEQMQLLKEYNISQAKYFNKIKDQLYQESVPLIQQSHDSSFESLNSQIAQLEIQVQTLSDSNNSLLQEVDRYRNQTSTLRIDNDLKFKQLNTTKKDLISQMKLVETQLAELQSLRIDNRITKLQLIERTQDLQDVRKTHSRFLEQQSKMSQVRSEYKLQGADAYMKKNLDTVSLENQDLKLKVHELSSNLLEMQGSLSIFKEDYQLMKNSYENMMTRALTEDVPMRAPLCERLTLESETQTMGSNVEAEMLSALMNHEDELYQVNEALMNQFELLIQVFYAYSRSETKIDEKEIQFSSEMEVKEKDLAEFKKLLDAQQVLNKTFREKMQQMQTQLATQTATPQQNAPRTVVQNTGSAPTKQVQQLTSEKQALDQRLNALIREKQTLETQLTQLKTRLIESEEKLTRIRIESTNSANIMKQRSHEQLAEIDKLKKQLQIGQVEPTVTANEVVRKLMPTMNKAKRLIIGLESLIDEDQVMKEDKK